MNIRDIANVCIRNNLLLWAGAGYGKGVGCLRYLFPKLKSEFGHNGEVWITAPSGIASGLISGSTTHSLSGVGTGAGTVDYLKNRILKNKHAEKRWERLRCLVIDECSLLSLELFSKLEELARILKHNDEFFGGIRIILVGDFCQLPPCSDLTRETSGLVRRESMYLFEDEHLWEKGKFVVSICLNLLA
jgi:ATP-dependent DNA helicase PIF1